MTVLAEAEVGAAFMVTIGCFEDGGRKDMQSPYLYFAYKIFTFQISKHNDLIKNTWICVLVIEKTVNTVETCSSNGNSLCNGNLCN